MRTLIDIPDEIIAEIDALARRNSRSRAAEVRAALTRHLRDRSSNDWISRGAGFWRERDDIGDAVDYQRSIREDRNEH
jgi:hypothetical protein